MSDLEDHMDDFDRWMEQGGQGLTEQERALDKADRRRAIREGEITTEQVFRNLVVRMSRLISIYEKAGVDFLIGEFAKAVEDGAKELRISVGHSDEDAVL